MKLKDSDVNHLRRLLGYVRCEIWQSPEELKAMLRAIGEKVDISNPSDAVKARMVETYQKAERVPQYVRAAVKALEKLLADAEGITVDGVAQRERHRMTIQLERLARPKP